MMDIRIVQLGKGIVRFAVRPGLTLADALAEVGIDAGGLDVRVNGKDVEATASLGPGDLVTLVPRVKGGLGAEMNG
jgi:sulfur carrier protein ThiS